LRCSKDVDAQCKKRGEEDAGAAVEWANSCLSIVRGKKDAGPRQMRIERPLDDPKSVDE
jgi:hypothetical protein